MQTTLRQLAAMLREAILGRSISNLLGTILQVFDVMEDLVILDNEHQCASCIYVRGKPHKAPAFLDS